jgi:hypothetical protein
MEKAGSWWSVVIGWWCADDEGGRGHSRRFGFVWYLAIKEIFIRVDWSKTNKRGNDLVFVLEELRSIKDGMTTLLLTLMVISGDGVGDRDGWSLMVWWKLWRVDGYCIFRSNMEDEDGKFFYVWFFYPLVQ